MMNRLRHSRGLNTSLENKLILTIILLLLIISLFFYAPSNRASAEDLPYKVLSLDRNITVRENKSLRITDTFHLSFLTENRFFIYRLPRNILSEKTVGNKTHHKKSIALITNVAVTVNGEAGRSQVSQVLHHSSISEYLIETTSVEGKLTGKPVIAITYDYDIGMDRNKGFDDLTIPLTYNRFSPQKLHVLITFPKNIKNAELSFHAAADLDEYRRTDTEIEYFYTDYKLERTEAVVMQIILDKGYYSYESVFSRLNGLYYATFAITLACIGASTFLFLRKKLSQTRTAEVDVNSNYLELSQVAICILGIVPILLAIFVYTTIAKLSFVWTIGFGLFSVIGYFLAYYEWDNKNQSNKKRFNLPYISIFVFSFFFLAVYALLILAFCSYAYSMDIFYVGIIAPIWATISRMFLWPGIQKTKRPQLRRSKAFETKSQHYVQSINQTYNQFDIQLDEQSNNQPHVQSQSLLPQQGVSVRKNHRISKQTMLKIGSIAMFVSIASVIIVGAITAINQSDGFIDGIGTLVGYEKRITNDGTMGGHDYVYSPIVSYEYEGVTYTETAPYSSYYKTRTVGETMDIQINPLIPSEFVIKTAQSIIWVIFIVIGLIFFMLLALAVFYPYLKKKYSTYEWGGILMSSILIVFSIGIISVMYFSMPSEGIVHFFTVHPWAYFNVAFGIIGVLLAGFEIVRAIRIAWYKKRDINKYNKLREKKKFYIRKKIK